MDQAGLKQQWLVWAEKNIGGPEARTEFATQAAISALGQGKSRDEAVAAARSAAADWKTPSEPTPPDSRVADLQLPSGEQERIRVDSSPAQLERTPQLARPISSILFAVLLSIIIVAATLWLYFSLSTALSSWSQGRGTVAQRQSMAVHQAVTFSNLVAVALGLLAIFGLVRLWRGNRARFWRQSRSSTANVETHKKFIRGRVAAMQQRQEIEGYHHIGRTRVPTYGIVWSFRLQVAGPDGNPLPPVAIEMRAPSFIGLIGNGDQLEVEAGDYATGSILCLKEVRNLSTNSVVRGTSHKVSFAWKSLLLGIAIILLTITSALLLAWHLKNSH